MGRLTTTSYALLGLLAMRDWAAYDLTKEVRSSLRFCWPRAEARIYEEPKNLVAHGLAAAKTEQRKGRSRTVYSITPAGRRALQAWLAEPSRPLSIESEAVVKLVFADLGDRDALAATLGQMEEHAIQIRQEAVAQAPRYIESVGLTPERLHNLVLGMGYLTAVYDGVAAWARAARESVEARPKRWPVDEVQRTMEQLALFDPDRSAAAQAPPPAS